MLTDEERNHLLSIADTVASLHAVDVDHRRGHCLAAAERIRAIADAPPTVAELLPMVDATHEVRWQSASAPDVTLRARLGTARGIVFEARLDDRSAWVAICALPSDITQPARLVEVTP